MTRTSILSVIPTLESGPGSQRLRSPNCVPGADRSPAPGRVAERSTAVPTARSGRKASEMTGKSCRYADTRQNTRRDRAVRLGRRVRSRRAAPVPARRHPKTRTRNLKYRIMKHLLLLLALLCLAQRSAAPRRQNLPKPGRLPERPVRDRARPVSETARSTKPYSDASDTSSPARTGKRKRRSRKRCSPSSAIRST